MSMEQNKAVARQMVEQIFNQGNISQADELLAADFVDHEELPAGLPGGREGVKQLTVMMHNAFPDLKVRIEDIIAEGDKVVIRMTWSGTQRGEWMGFPSTGKRFSIQAFDIIRFAGGKFAEHWGQMDNVGMMQQLGLMPTPGHDGS